jgi:hypothetical protein
VSDRGTLAVVLASLSLGLAVSTFVWQVVAAVWLDAPRLLVRVAAMNLFQPGGPSRPRRAVQVEVINRGKRPTEVRSIWLQIGKPPTISTDFFPK